MLNNYLCLYPRPIVSALLASGDVVDTDILDALSAVDEDLIARAGRVYLTGLNKIEPRELDTVELGDVLPAALRRTLGRVAN